MDFKQIEAFISVAKYKSFSKAANSVFLSQPAVSSHIATLEKELNVQLFDRTSKEVLLTPAGESFLNYAIEILNTRDKAISYVSNFNTHIKGKLKIGASTTPCNVVLPDLIKTFNNKYPDVSYSIFEQSSGKIKDDIVKFNCEIGIIGSNVSDDKIKCYKLLEDNLVLISSPELDLPEEMPMESILKYKFVMREKTSATRKTFEDSLNNLGFNPTDIDICCEVNSLDSLFQFVKNGIGISVISEAVCNDYLAAYNVKKTHISNVSLKRDIYLVLSSKRTLTPTAKAFFNLCKEIYNFN